MPADGQAFLDHDPAATTGLRAIGGIDGDYPATGAYCLMRQDGEEGAVDPQDYVLPDLAVDFAVVGHGFLGVGQLGLLLGVRDGDTTQAVRFAALSNGGVIDVTA